MIQKIKNLDNLTAKFVIVGFVGFVANYSVLLILTREFHINKVAAEVVAVAFALQITFLLHDSWTYIRSGHADKKDLKIPIAARYGLYIANNSLSSLSTILLFSLFIQVIGNDLIALGAAAVLQTIWNYTINRWVIWRHRDEAKPASSK